MALTSGCAVTKQVQDAPKSSVQNIAVQPEARTLAADESLSDAAICTAFADVYTVIWNADVALEEGRIAEQEHLGWYALTTRILDRLPSNGDSDVRTAIAGLKEAAPVINSGGYAESTGVGSESWNAALGKLGSACEAVSITLSGEMFTGG